MTWMQYFKQSFLAPRTVLRTLLFGVVFCVPAASLANADTLGAASDVPRKALQELVHKKRERGHIYIAIPQAKVFGDSPPYQPYCSPQIRAVNSSHKTIVELVLGIRYRGKRSEEVGSTLTRFALLKADKEDTHYFYSSLHVDYCVGLVGELEVLECSYDSGEDCSDDVKTVNYGAIPLRAVDKKESE